MPAGIDVVAAVKDRTLEEIREAVEAGIRKIGGNYLSETVPIVEALGRNAEYHFIGHLQTNKVKKAVDLFDMIQTVDSLDLGQEIDRRCKSTGRKMSVLVEVNSGREPQKAGVLPEKAEELVRNLAGFSNLIVQGLMTMGPFLPNAEDIRPFFSQTRTLFERIRSAGIPGVEMKILSMGMTDSYRIAVEEGATMVRIGTGIFGERK
jgi:pyridoxal phosphate enzyme (YggS family)